MCRNHKSNPRAKPGQLLINDRTVAQADHTQMLAEVTNRRAVLAACFFRCTANWGLELPQNPRSPPAEFKVPREAEILSRYGGIHPPVF